MKRFLVDLAVLGGLAAGTALTIGPAHAQDADLLREIRVLKERLAALEQQMAEQPAVAPAAPAQSGTLEAMWNDRITLSGAIEVEGSYVDASGDDASDITLATVELGVDARINDWVDGHILLLFEEDDTDPIDVDEGFITISNPETTPFWVSIGRMYVPFGNFKSHMISDPLTLEIGETRETAILAGVEAGGFYTSVYVANGDAQDPGDDHVTVFGGNIGFAMETEDGLGVDVGGSVTNNLADSDAIQGAVPLPTGLVDETPGFGLHGIMTLGAFTLIGEYLAATESFAAADLPFGATGANPESWNIEGAVAFELADLASVFAVAVQGTDEAVALGLPEERYLASLSVEVLDHTALAVEWAHDEDYGTAVGGTGSDTDTFTVQFAVEF